MNLLDWEHTQRVQRRDQDPKQWIGVEEKTGNVLRTGSERDPYCGYSRYPSEEPHTSMGEADVQWEHHSPSSHILPPTVLPHTYSKESTAFTSGRDTDPDGESVEMSEGDQELARKMRQLQEIEEQIILKKTAIALKTVDPFAKKNKPYRAFKEETDEDFADSKAGMSMKKNEPFMQLREEKEAGISNSEQSGKGATLKDRVNVILQQKHPLGFRTKVHSPSSDIPNTLHQSPNVANSFAAGINSASLSKDGLWLEDHPLKLRVKALMRQRCSNPCVLQSNGEVPDVKPHPSKSPNSPVQEANSVSKGFQRFLSVLNKGVDIDLLARIVTDDSEDLPVGGELLNIQPPILENKSNVPYRSESQGSHSGALQQDHCRSNSGERRTEITSQEGSHKERHSLPDEEFTQSNDGGGDPHLGLNSSLRSPPAVEEKKPKVDEQQQQLQNILKTLGLSLEVDEISKLADRTQERLYGKKHDDSQRVDDRAERDRRQASFQRPLRNSSSTSVSGSFTPSPPRHQRSPGKDSRDSREQRQTSECSHSRARSRDEETAQQGDGDKNQAQRCKDTDMDGIDSRESFPGDHPEKPTHHSAHPAADAALPEYDLAQYSQYTAYSSSAYNGAASSTWEYTHDAVPSSPYSSDYPYPQNPSYHVSGSKASAGRVYSDPWPTDTFSPKDARFRFNPDLSKSEGQNGEQLGPRCLQVITTKPLNKPRYLMHLTNTRKPARKTKERRQKNNQKRRIARKVRREKKRTEAMSAKPDSLTSMEVLGAPVEANTETQQSKECKMPPTEEEIKANLKKRLEVFNQKMKQKASRKQPNLKD